MATAPSVVLLSLLYMRPLQDWLKRVPVHTWHLGCLYIKVDHGCVLALACCKAPHLYRASADLRLVSRRKVVLTDASNKGFGAMREGRMTSGSWSSAERLPWNTGSQNLPTRPQIAPRPSPLGQNSGGVLHKPTRWTQIEATVQTGETPPLMGIMQPALAGSQVAQPSPV